MVERLTGLAALPLEVVRRSAGDLFDRWAQRLEAGKRRDQALETYNLIGPWSSASLRFCTSETKAQVIGPALVRQLRGETIINVLGIRRDESTVRAATPEWKPDTRYAPAGNQHGTRMMLWHPLVHWGTANVFAAHDALGIPLHEAYTCYASSRLSCRFCVLQSIGDARASASAPANRDALLHLVDLEATSTFSFQPSRWLADVAPTLIPPGLAARISSAKLDAEHRRRSEAALPKSLRFCEGWPPRMPTAAEADAIALTRAPILARHGLTNHYPAGDDVLGRFAHLISERDARGEGRRLRPN